MSRSIHQSNKSVFGRKSKAEIEEMIEEEDPDVRELLRKRQYKEQARAERRRQRDGAPADPSDGEED